MATPGRHSKCRTLRGIVSRRPPSGSVPPSVVLEEAINVKRNRSGAAISVLTAAALVLSGCSKQHSALAYANGARVDCGGAKAITASGSSAQANAMTAFIAAFNTALCL